MNSKSDNDADPAVERLALNNEEVSLRNNDDRAPADTINHKQAKTAVMKLKPILVKIRVCPFCGDIPSIRGYSVDNAHCLGGPLFAWNVKIRCDCCAEINGCLTAEEAVDAWNSSSAPYSGERWDLEELDTILHDLPEAGPDQEMDL